MVLQVHNSISTLVLGASQVTMLIHLQGNYENGAAYTFILLITFWILYSYLVPISLFVTMEIVKFWQGFIQMQADDEM